MKIVISIILILITFCSCIHEPLLDVDCQGSSGYIPVNLNTASTDKEIAIKKMRILVFETSTQKLISNTVFTGITPNSGYKVNVESGINDFYIIANETEGMTSSLQTVGRVSDLDAVLVDPILGTLPLPLYGRIKNVTIQISKNSSEAAATLENGVSTSLLTIAIERLMTKLSLTFIKNIPATNPDFIISDIFISIKQTPKYSFLPENKPYTATTQWANTIQVASAPNTTLSNDGEYTKNGDIYEVPEGVDYITIKDIYIPEHILQDCENSKFASYIVINAKFTNKETAQTYESSYRLNLSHGLLNYNLYRNNQYNIYATIVGMGSIGLHATIVPMKIKEISVGWTPSEGLAIVSDLITDYGKNQNVWNIYAQYSGILKIGNNDKYRDILFKYGSVVGISNDDASDSFNPTQSVIWRPSSFNSTISAWSDIPFMLSGVVQPNTPENIKKGIGDPCRLVGLTDKQIASDIVDNKAWRMATAEEYKQLIEFKDLRDFDNRGFYSLKYFLIPGAKTRDEAGAIYSTANTGEYWSSDDCFCLQFDASTSNQVELIQGAPQKAFSIRCVRAEGLPLSSFAATGGTVGYSGGIASIQVKQGHVPFWRVSLISGDASAITLPDPSEGSFDGYLPITVAPLPDPYQPRSFTFQVIGYGVDGKFYQKNVVIDQLILEHFVEVNSISPIPVSSNGYLYISKEGGLFSFDADITPVPETSIYNRMQWKVYIRPSTFGDDEPDIEGTIATSANKVTTVTIPENNTGDVRLIRVFIKETSSPMPNVRQAKFEFVQPGR